MSPHDCPYPSWPPLISPEDLLSGLSLTFHDLPLPIIATPTLPSWFPMATPHLPLRFSLIATPHTPLPLLTSHGCPCSPLTPHGHPSHPMAAHDLPSQLPIPLMVIPHCSWRSFFTATRHAPQLPLTLHDLPSLLVATLSFPLMIFPYPSWPPGHILSGRNGTKPHISDLGKVNLTDSIHM